MNIIYSFFMSMILAMTLCSCSNTKTKDATEVSAKVEVKTESASDNVQTETKFYAITLSEALDKAEAEKKYVLIDCHTKTCGPCRKMEKEVFTDKECGDFINSRFITLQVDMEEGEGIEIAKKHNVMIYPTYLILTPQDEKVGEIVGAELNKTLFIEKLKAIING